MRSLAQYMDLAGYHHRALPLLLESIAFFKSEALTKDRLWALEVIGAMTSVANIMRMCGHLEEAASILEEAIEVHRKARLPDSSQHFWLMRVNFEMKRLERIIKVGRETERFLYAAQRINLPGFAMQDYSCRLILYSTMANAYEELGRLEECAHYHKRAMGILRCTKQNYPEMMSCYDRTARQLWKNGHRVAAEEVLGYLVLNIYKRHLSGRSMVTGSIRSFYPALRPSVDFKRHVGKDAEALALELDLDETEAIVESAYLAFLSELREDLRSNAAAADGGQQQQRNKKPTRKQRKRKAAQRRRAQERRAAERDEESEDDVEGDMVDGLTVATRQFKIEDTVVDNKGEVQQAVHEQAEPEECLICSEDLSSVGDDCGVLLACTHIFHVNCLDQWKEECLVKGMVVPLPYVPRVCGSDGPHLVDSRTRPRP